MKKRLKIYDFDGTLVFTPTPESLIEGWPARDHYDRWLSMNNKPKRKWMGWWGRVETLMPPIFGHLDEAGEWIMPPELLNTELVELHKEHVADEENLNVLMTGRHRKMTHPEKKEHVTKMILDKYGLVFDEYYFTSDFTPTLQFKCNTIETLLEKYPTLEEIEIWEDREAHYSKFWEFVKYLKKQGRIKSGMVHLVTVPERLMEWHYGARE